MTLTDSLVEPPDVAALSVAKDGNTFAFDLYARLRSQESGNLFFSPQSISTALAMTYAGARGETATQMARTLRFSLPQDRLSSAYGKLLKALHLTEADRDYQLSVANRLWGQHGESFCRDFSALIHRDYGAELGQVDFRQNAESARDEINAWVLKQTGDKIRDLLPAGLINSLTRLVLVNAIYFRGDWAQQFEKKWTTDRPFHATPNHAVTVPMMFTQADIGFAAYTDSGVKVVELPYKGEDLSMLGLLPDAIDGLDRLESMLTAENVGRWTAGLRSCGNVSVYLPRFSVESSVELTHTVSAMGMPLAFSHDADFSGMNRKRNLWISAMAHQARVDVDEEGTQAAAATAVVMTLGGPRPVFRADHPFVFIIRHNPTGAILFLGRVLNPKA